MTLGEVPPPQAVPMVELLPVMAVSVMDPMVVGDMAAEDSEAAMVAVVTAVGTTETGHRRRGMSRPQVTATVPRDLILADSTLTQRMAIATAFGRRNRTASSSAQFPRRDLHPLGKEQPPAW